VIKEMKVKEREESVRPEKVFMLGDRSHASPRSTLVKILYREKISFAGSWY
jgi:hypothetical protein